MTLTIYTDASYHPVHRCAAAAWYCKSESGEFSGTVPCPPEITDISLAETFAIAQAVYAALKRMPGIKQIVIKTDSAAAQKWLTTQPPRLSKSKSLQTRTRLYQAFMRDVGTIPFRIMKVQAHQDSRSPEAIINNLVDQMCRQENRKQINKQRSA